MVVVFPVPGPPVSTRTPLRTDSITALPLHLIQNEPAALFHLGKAFLDPLAGSSFFRPDPSSMRAVLISS